MKFYSNSKFLPGLNLKINHKSHIFTFDLTRAYYLLQLAKNSYKWQIPEHLRLERARDLGFVCLDG